MEFNIQLIIIVIYLLVGQTLSVPPIFNPAPFFTSSFHTLGLKATGSYTITLTSPVSHTNIISCGLAMAQVNRDTNPNIRFKTSIVPVATTGNQFTMTLVVYSASGMKLGFFLIVITQQADYKCIDLVMFGTYIYYIFIIYLDIVTTDFNNNNDALRTIQTPLDVSTNSIMLNTTNVQLFPIISYFNLQLGVDSSNNPVTARLDLKASIINTTHIKSYIELARITKMEQFGHFILIVNKNQINRAMRYNLIFDYNTKWQWLGKDGLPAFDIKVQQPSFSTPNVQYKCFVGNRFMTYRNNSFFQYSIILDGTGQYHKYDQIKNSANVNIWIGSFCFGANPTCPTGTILQQLPTLDCVNPCTLAIPSGYTSLYTLTCPKCLDIICQECASDRTTCYSCLINTFSTIDTTTNKCVCDIGYRPGQYNLSADGITWLTRTKSFDQCLINCTYHIPECLIDQCTNITVCTECITNYYPNVINTTHTDCEICNFFLPNCIDCINSTSCANCSSGYFQHNATLPSTIQIQCALCLDYIDHCLICDSQRNCTNCQPFYGVDYSLLCSPCTYLHGENCLDCNSYWSCIQCKPITVLFDRGCRYCYEYVPHCTACYVDFTVNTTHGIVTCTQCAPQYYFDTGICKRCFIKINNCQTCIDQNNCTVCEYPYKLTSTNKCNSCQPGYVMYLGYCIKQAGCRVMSYTNTSTPSTDDLCIDCFSQLHWIYNLSTNKCQCQSGYQQRSISVTGGSTKICANICGDGILKYLSQQCDDGNVDPNDGCSPSCTIQTDYKCFNNVTAEITLKCVLYRTFTSLKYNYAYRTYGSYKGYISYSIQPAHIGLTTLNWVHQIVLSIGPDHLKPLSYNFNYQIGELLIQLQYFKDLQDLYLTASLNFDPNLVFTDYPTLTTRDKINGINAPLIIQGQSYSQIAQIIQMLFLGIVILYWIHFIIASYLHKMIGLQTIQILQSVYFLRLVLEKQKSSLLITSNNLKISNGYSNIDFLMQNQTKMGSNYSFMRLMTMNQQLIEIGQMKLFLMNVNWSLVPVVIIMIIYGILAGLRFYYQKQYLNHIKGVLRDKYVYFVEKMQLFYQHFVFPYMFQLQFITIFCTIQAFTSRQISAQITLQFDDFQTISVTLHILIFLLISFIFCLQIHKSYRSVYDIQPYKAVIGLQTPEERLQTEKTRKLEQFQPSHDKLYIFIYLIYYLLFMILMSIQIIYDNIDSLVQILLGLTSIYFIMIWKYSPYISIQQQDLSIHNHFLKFNHFVVVLFLIMCSVINRIQQLPVIFYESSIYFTIFLLSCVLTCGYIRLFLYYKYLKVKSQTMKRIFEEQQYELEKFNQKKQKQFRKQTLLKSNLFLHNPYLFDNQLKDMKRNYKDLCSDLKKILTQSDKAFLIDKMQQHNQQKYFNQICHNKFNYKPKQQQKSLKKVLPNIGQFQYDQQHIEMNRKKVPSIEKKFITQQFAQKRLLNKKKQKQQRQKQKQKNPQLNKKKSSDDSPRKQVDQKQQLRKRLKLSFLKKNLHVNQMLQQNQ